MPNRLALESSPYLLQHKDNPVDWYPWGPEALKRALDEDKPIILSVGYSACHWCHVMEHESFEDAETARLMNENFIAIKVDREERPDLDQIYQNVAMAITRGGGWPLTVFLTPRLEPFFGGTYFPPDDRYGRPGFKKVLSALAEAYRKDPAMVAENSGRLMQYIQSVESVRAGEPSPGAEAPSELAIPAFAKSAETLLSHFDWENGGFGGAPKFPNAMAVTFLWWMGCATQDANCKRAAILTLKRMAMGGIYDQLGGGFHRYSVDATWSVPHFEKMLYDNGLLLKLYSEVLLSGDPSLTGEDSKLFRSVLIETSEYLAREMRSSEGAFYAAQDADSEGEEGKFFAWGVSDLEHLRKTGILADDEVQAAVLRFGISPEGNFEHSKTVLFQAGTLADSALIESVRKKLLAERSKRVPPATDHKILVSWNGLAISGLAWAARALRHSGNSTQAARALEMAERAFEYLAMKAALPAARHATGSAEVRDRLAASVHDGRAKGNGFLDDYAYLAQAALELARSTENDEKAARYTAQAAQWLRSVLTHFVDPEGPGYFFTSDDHEKLIHRPKSVTDQAIPSGAAVAIGCMTALAELQDDPQAERFRQEATSQLGRLASAALENPFSSGEMLCAGLLQLQGPVTVSGPGAENVCLHPNVFRKAAGDRPEKLVCHRRTCSTPFKDDASFLSEALKKSQPLK